MKPILSSLILLTLACPLLADTLSNGAANDQARQKNLAKLARVIKNYREVHNGKGPEKISDLYYEGYIDDLSPFVIPGSATKLRSRTELDAKSDYTIDPLPGQPDVVVRERKPLQQAGEVLAAFNDGTIRPVPAAASSAETQGQESGKGSAPIAAQGSSSGFWWMLAGGILAVVVVGAIAAVVLRRRRQ